MVFTPRPTLKEGMLESICKMIADTNLGLTNSEIEKTLSDCSIKDVNPGLSKWKRLYNAFAVEQNKRQCSNSILKFIQVALTPVRYLGKEYLFQYRRNELNKRLAFIGLEMQENGIYRVVDSVSTISEAEQRASKFKYKLESRNSHKTIFKYCSAELLVENYFHAVFEAVKSLADRIRELTLLTYDGNQLIEVAFSKERPYLKINELKTDTDKSEHIGLSNLAKGIFGIIRNPTAHEPKIKFEINEEQALDIMSVISFIHKQLDKAKPVH